VLSLKNDSASSHSVGTVLIIGVTIILAALVLLLSLQFPNLWGDSQVPAVFEITTIRHTNQYGNVNLESYMIVENTGDVAYDNRKLYAKTYRNGQLLPCFIPVINFNEFIDVHPYGIETIGGSGTNNYHWYPGGTIFIDYSQGTFRPGDIVQFEVYDRESNQLISRDTWPHRKGNTEKWMNLLFSHRGA
jgi:hypothetical protein